MVVQLRPRSFTVERGSRGFGLSLIYRGLDKYEEKDTGIFVARVVPGGRNIFQSLKIFLNITNEMIRSQKINDSKKS